MNQSDGQQEKDSVWQKTNFANLVRYKPSQIYFARFRVNGNLIRRSLKTNLISVAKLRLADLEKAERQKVRSSQAVANGKMTFGEAFAVFKTWEEADLAIIPCTKEYYGWRFAYGHEDRGGEARHLGRLRFIRGETTVRGDPSTGAKNSEIRAVPMIPDIRESLETPVLRCWKFVQLATHHKEKRDGQRNYHPSR